jgi:large subunit ribosomal protein L4
VSPEKKRREEDAEAKAAEQTTVDETVAGEDAAEAPVSKAGPVDVAETAAEDAAVAASDKAPAAKPKRARAKSAVAETTAAEDAEQAPAAEVEKPKTRRPRSSARKTAEAPEAVVADAEAPETVVEAEAEVGVAGAPEPVAEDAAEPVAEEAAEPVAGPTPEAAAEPEPPKVTRAKAAKARAKQPHAEHHAVEKPAPGRAAIIDAEGKEIEVVELDEKLFGVPAAVAVLHLVVRAEQAARRRGTASTKTRGEVSGSTAKLYRQKGTGRARAGSAKSPTRTHGGTAFGPKPRDYDIKVNRKVRRKALAMALSDRATGGDIYVARGLALDSPSTSRVNEFLAGLDIPVPVLVVTDGEPVVARSVRNLRYAEPADVRMLSTEQVLRARSLVLTEKAFAALSEVPS